MSTSASCASSGISSTTCTEKAAATLMASGRAAPITLGEIHTAVMAVGGEMLITADHGNAEQMFDFETGQPLPDEIT